MRRLKKTMLSILGEFPYLLYSDLKERYYPSIYQKEILEFEKILERNRVEFYSLFVNKNDLCFDIGANKGNRISPLLKIGAKVVAVEPQRPYVKFLKYKFGNQINIVPKGVGNIVGKQILFISDASTLSSFSKEWIYSVMANRFKNYRWTKKVQVEMTTLDNLISTFGEPDFIKIDVEGYELEVLQGLSKSIKMISFEYTVPEQTGRIVDCIDQISKYNKNLECNYSIGERMTFVFTKWQSIHTMRKFIYKDDFLASSFGDIYIRQSVE